MIGEAYPRPARPAVGIAVVGAGSWGTALAVHCARAGHATALWGRDPAKVAAMAAARHNLPYLPAAEFPELLKVTSDPAAAFAGADIVISAVPSRHTRGMWGQLSQVLDHDVHLVSATKGIEEHSGLRMSQVLSESVDRLASVSSLSGPSFAEELVLGHPTAVTLGCVDVAAAHSVQAALSAGPLRVYRNEDLIGVEIGGALKNVIAIAAGIVSGLGFGSNTQAALISRGLKEITVLAAACGGRPATLMGLSGLGDLVLTCTGPLSRNRGVGVELARGRTLDEITATMEMVAEGAVTARSTHELAARLEVEMPIAASVYAVLYEGLEPRAGIESLLARALVEEWES
jgi:glycerol-3-phosphate dehydrogenase (NAD(P)+)